MSVARAKQGDADFAIDPEGFDARAINSLVDFRGKNVLEIGAGDGRLTWCFADGAKSVLAIDPRAREVRRAIAATPDHLRSKIRFIEADATTYRYPTAKFDIAILSYSLC